MRQGILFIVITLGLTKNASSQFKNLLKKAKDKTRQRADSRVDKEMDKTLDKAEGKTKPVTSGVETSEATEPATPTEDNSVKSYAKFDFIPGDSILYAEDFQNEELGELPVNWNTSGTGEVTTLDKFSGQWLKLHKSFTYLSVNQKQFGVNHTIEFDLILQLKSNGWMYPEFKAGFFASGDEAGSGNQFLKQYEKNAAVSAVFYPAEYGGTRLRLRASQANKNHYQSDAKAYEALEKSYGKPVHIAIHVQQERFWIWINGDKNFDAPKAVPAGHIMSQLFFEVSPTNYSEAQYGIYVSNIKIATGKPDTRHKLVEEGKFSTTGILFYFQRADIKPESYGVIKEIAAVLKEHTAIRIKVLGHTSSDGDYNANMEPSKKRAAAGDLPIMIQLQRESTASNR